MSELRHRLAVLFGVWAVCVFAPPLDFVFRGPFSGSVRVVDWLDRYLPQLAGDHDDLSVIDSLRREVLS